MIALFGCRGRLRNLKITLVVAKDCRPVLVSQVPALTQSLRWIVNLPENFQ